jgi:hypothetical protein
MISKGPATATHQYDVAHLMAKSAVVVTSTALHDKGSLLELTL